MRLDGLLVLRPNGPFFWHGRARRVGHHRAGFVADRPHGHVQNRAACAVARMRSSRMKATMLPDRAPVVLCRQPARRTRRVVHRTPRASPTSKMADLHAPAPVSVFPSAVPASVSPPAQPVAALAPAQVRPSVSPPVRPAAALAPALASVFCLHLLRLRLRCFHLSGLLRLHLQPEALDQAVEAAVAVLRATAAPVSRCAAVAALDADRLPAASC